MDRYAVFGLLLLFQLGQTQDVRIDFTSPVMTGDDVNITCTWVPYVDFLQANWYRQTETANEETLYTFHTSGISAEPGFEFVKKHAELNEFSYTIKLVGAKKEDEGTYWCAVKYFVGLSLKTSSSNKKQLDVIARETSNDRSIANVASTTTSGLGRYDNTQVGKGLDTSTLIAIGGSVGGVVAVLLLVVIILLVLILWRNNKRTTGQSGQDPPAGPAQGEPMQRISHNPQILNQGATEQQYEDISVKQKTTEQQYKNTPRDQKTTEQQYKNTPRSQATAEQQYKNTPRSQANAEQQYENTPRSRATAEQQYENTPRDQATAEQQYDELHEISNYQDLGNRPQVAAPVYSDLLTQAGQE